MDPSFQTPQPPDATPTLRGLINLLAQSFSGVKTFLAQVVLAAGLNLQGALVSNGNDFTGDPKFTDGARFTGRARMSGNALVMSFGQVEDPVFYESTGGGSASIGEGGHYFIQDPEYVEAPDPSYSNGAVVTLATPLGAKVFLLSDLLNDPRGYGQQVGVIEIVNNAGNWDQGTVYAISSTPLTAGGVRVRLDVFPYFDPFYGFSTLRVEARRVTDGALVAVDQTTEYVVIAKVA